MNYPDPLVKTPVQQRSRDTLERIARATRDLLAETVFEELTLQQIVSRAQCSVGTFYQRFANKDAILPYLLTIHYEEIRHRLEHMLSRMAGKNLEQRVAEVVYFLATNALKDRGLIRTLVLRNQQRPESIPTEIRGAASEMLESIYRSLLECEHEIEHRAPRPALQVGLLMVSATVRERLVMVGSTQASTLDLDAPELTRELTAALLAYLHNPIDIPVRSFS